MLQIVRPSAENEHAQNESAEPIDGYGEPSAIIPAPRGLPPMRARLARYLAWRKTDDDDLATLKAGRAGLLVQIAKAEEAKSRAATEADAGATSILDKIKSGKEWSIRDAITSAHLAATQALAGSAPSLDVARAALAKLDAEIEIKTRLAETIADRNAEFVNAALREHAKAELGREYREAIDAVRDTMTRLEALERMTGAGHDGRLVAELPGFRAAGQRHDVLPVVALPSDISAAIAAWQALGRAWARNPRAEPSKHLKFASHDPNAADVTPYEALTALERRIADIENVA